MKGNFKKLMATFMLFLHIISLADGIVPNSAANKNLQVDKAANGVPLVNIETPDNNGTSHNVYKDYNVDGRGAILNNSKDLTNTQLGGFIYGNPNLQKSNEASTIINEVSGVNKSRIEGYQEIAGKRANYILANPNGIYVNGAGFINTGNVTLTTGRGNNLLNPEKGMIEVAGKGLDLRNINKAELVARVAELSAPIYGGEEVNLKLGSKNNKPEYALDARALGSIYAGRINIIVNEDGVGVKTQAPMYATKGDIVISSRGKVYLKDTQAKGDIKISSAETEIGNKLLAENSINIESGKTSNSGEIKANNNIRFSGNVDSSNLISTNKDITISGNLKNSGKILSKNINTKDLNNSGELYSENLTTTNLENSNKINIKENINSSNILNKTNNSEIISKNLNTSNLNNKGNVKVVNNVTSQEITNNGKLLVGNKVITNNIDNTEIVETKNLNSTNKIKSSGKILSNSITTKDISNSGNIYSKAINTQNLVNSGEVISNDLSSNNINNLKDIYVNGNLKANNLINSSKIESKNVEVDNLNNSGNIKVSDNLTTKDITNSNSIQVGKNINAEIIKNSNSIQARNITIEKSLDNSNGKLKSIDTNINTFDIKNDNGEILSSNNINIITANDINLSGKYIANNTLKIDAKSLINNINLENSGKIKLDLKENLINNKKINSSNDLNITAKKVVNIGEIGSMAKLDIDTDRLENNGALLFGNNDENKLTIKENTQNTGIINSLGKLEINTQDFENKGQIASIKDLKINSKNFTNNEDSLIFSNENVKFDLKNDFLNKGEIYSGKNIDIKALGAVTNNTATISAQNNIDINAKKITNIGKVEKKNPTIERKSALDSDTNITEKQREEAKKYFQELVNRKNNEKGIENPGRYTEGSYLFKDFKAEWIEKVKSNDVSKLSYITADNNISLTSKEDILNEEGNILANNDITITAPKVINRNSTRDVDIKIGWKAPIYEVTYTEGHDYGGEHEGHNGSGGGGHYSTSPVGTEEYIGKTTQTIGADKASKIAAGKNLTINAQKVGNGFKDNETNDIKNKNTVINKVNLAENNVNIDNVNLNRKKIEDKKVIDTKDYIFIPKGDKGLFKINKNESNKPGFSYLIETNIKYIDKSMFLGSDYFFKRIGFNPDRDIRLLGDSMYETRLINRAILEGTGRRYLGDYKSEKEQMKALYDNAVSEKEDLKLSMGIALSKNQIAKLKKDIIWYVEEEIEGQKVLVPKVYLTKNTLSKLKDNATSLEAGEDFNISANEITNTGAINAKNLNIKTDNLVNKSSSENLATINADNIDIEAKEALSNIGATIKADKDLKVTANKVENISTHHINTNIVEIKKDNFENIASIEAGNNIDIKAKDVTNTAANIKANNDITIESDNTKINTLVLKDSENRKNYENTIINNVGSEITGKNISINANNDIGIVGSDIKAKEKLSLNTKNVDISSAESNLYERSSNRSGYTINEIKRNVASNIEAKNIDISATKDVDIKGSNIVAKEETNVKADGNVNIVSATDSNYSEHKETHKKSFGRSKSEENISYQTYNVASNILGDKVNITSGKDVNVFGSNVQANTEGQIKADGNITQAGVKDINYSYHKKTKTGFMGLTSKSITDENYAEKAILSATLAGNDGLTYDSKNNLILSGVKVVSSGNINLKGNNVEINPLETKSYNKHEEVKKGFSGSFNAKGASLSYGKDKLESNTDIVNQTASQIVSNKDINIEATDKVRAKSVDIYAKNDVNISGDNGVEISIANNSYDNTTKQSSSRIGASIGINSAIVNTVENVRDIKELTDFSRNSYDILNNASKVVGAIKDGATATNDLINYKYSGTDSTGAETLKNNPNIFKTSISYSKSKSESKVHNETVEKSSLTSGNNMNIKSKNGSITISGTDVKVGNDLDLNAKKDITIKASEENYTSSNSSSQMGIGLSADLSKGKIGDLSISKAGTNGRGNGTNYVNSTIEVGGKLKTNSENLTISGGNVEADKLDIKAKNLVIESKQDKSERKDSSYGGSFSIDLANPSSFSANINGSKGSGEKEWVNKQTSLIARNGGKVNTDNLTNIGAIIGSESDKERLKISANRVVVKDLEDKNKYENIGGGITFGTDVPNTSIKHDKVDKEQINRATAINTDFEISGEKRSAEDLGFNTDIDKAQEKTKDEEKHLDAELHTDLIGEDKRNEIKYAFKKLGSLHEILDQKKFKESMEGVLVDKFKDEHQKEFNLIKDKNLSLEDKQKLAQNLVERYLRENGYEGIIPEVLLTDEAHSFTVDSKDKETGAKRREKIYFSINDIADPNLAFSRLFGHEKAHMNTYDEGENGEATSLHTTKKIGSENKNKVFTEEEKANYLGNLRDKYKNQKSIEQQFTEAKLIPEKDKEHWYDKKTHNEYKYKVTFTKVETKYLTKKYKISEKELKEDPTKYVYFESLDKNNRVFKDKKEFEKFQNELKEKIKNEKDPKRRKELEKQIYKKLPNTESQYHNIKIDENGKPYIDTTFPNEKYANNIGQEAVFEKKSGKWVKDGINDATYNVAYWEKNYKVSDLYNHLYDEKGDVDLWEDYGVGPHDKLTKEQRKEISELGKIYLLDLSFRRYANKNKKASLADYIKYKEETLRKWE
ncbi:hemagglutinin repeat-containing protein [Fusobacterium nucleatum]|uniref:hemagglutinin repeat-containing protein n=1 Tax=Fusobacterium nucleatum TaxID=851 RepID=UPI00235F0CF5|nr:hemagglutinin repeat-containing protein [Fusobacterium nucleatum]WDD88489.1 hemagglutinin repeat-containing protein [Fusobacterium nucleatum]